MTKESAMDARKVYAVEQGWVRTVQVGGSAEERYSDSPTNEEFGTYEEAKAAFDAIDLRQAWRTEKMCAGRAWDGRDAYKAIESYTMDEDECADDFETVEVERYGQSDEEEA